MNSARAKAVIAVVLLIAAVVLFILLQPGDEDPSGTYGGGAAATSQTSEGATGNEGNTTTDQGNTPPEKPAEPEIPVVTVRDGQPVGGTATLDFKSGSQIRFKVRSDVAEEVHVHGFDVSKDVPAGGQVSFDFPADLEGVFEVELEHSAVQIIELRIFP